MRDEILVTQSSLPSFEEFVEEIRPMWESHWLTNMGTYHRNFEQSLKEYLLVKELSLFVNGHMALELTLQALNLKGEVITTPFTFASTTHAIVRNGLEPVFCDIKLNDCTIDEKKIESLITSKTSAIIPVHVYGNVCAMEEIERIAANYNLKVIYDAAHAFGVKYKGKGIGDFGDASMFSFHATKVFHSIEGGATVYREKEIGETLYRLKNFGIKSPECVDGVGSNAKMNEFQAAMGICNLRHIEEEILKRKRLAECYRFRFEGVEGIQIMSIQKEVVTNYAYFPIIVEENMFGANRDDICCVLNQNNIYPRKYFYPLTNTFECYENRFDVTKTPNALHISERVLTLPIYAELSISDVDRICDIVLSLKK